EGYGEIDTGSGGKLELQPVRRAQDAGVCDVLRAWGFNDNRQRGDACQLFMEFLRGPHHRRRFVKIAEVVRMHFNAKDSPHRPCRSGQRDEMDPAPAPNIKLRQSFEEVLQPVALISSRVV